HVGPLEGLDDAALPEDPAIPVRRRRGGRDSDRAVEPTPPDLVDLVLRSTRDEAGFDGLSLAERDVVVQPRRQPVEVDHRLPTSCSRYSANLALAASSLAGIHSVGHMPSVAR